MINLELTNDQAEMLFDLLGGLDETSVGIILAHTNPDKYSREYANRVHKNNAYIWDILNRTLTRHQLFNGISATPIVMDGFGKERCPECYKELDAGYHGLKMCYCKYCGERIIR